MTKAPCVLVIEDDDDVAELVQSSLTDDGMTVTLEKDGARGLSLAQTTLPDLIILDMGLPSIRGTEVCRQLKGNPATQAIPVVFLTGRIDEADVVLGLEIGGEDYIKKPFSPKELAARIRAVLRRVKRPASAAGAPFLKHDKLNLDRSRFETSWENRPVALTQSEFQIVWLLVEQPGVVNSRERLIQGIGEGINVVDRTIDVHIASIRKKLGPQGKCIVTVRGVGYKWAD